MGEVKDEFGFFYEEAKDYINSIEKFIKKFEDASQQNHPKVQKYLERFTAKIFHNQCMTTFIPKKRQKKISKAGEISRRKYSNGKGEFRR